MSEVKIVYNIYVAVRKLWNAIFGKNGDGSSVELIKGNPTVTAEAPNLTSIEINGTSYKIELSPEQVQEAVDYYLSGDPSVFENVVAPLIAPEWEDDKAYKVGNLLSASGKMYLTIKDAPAGTPVTNTEYFEEKSVADIIEMIKQGAIVTGHSAVADNLTPYSEDSGAVQSNPFISQGTGTDNNSVIVTTGNIARQLEKQGNTVVKNQLVQNGNFESTSGWETIRGTISASNNVLSYTITEVGNDYAANRISRNINTIPTGHKVFLSGQIKALHNGVGRIALRGGNSVDSLNFNLVTGNNTLMGVIQSSNNDNDLYIGFNGVNGGYSVGEVVEFRNVFVVDLTQWGLSSDIITDLTSHPEHFSWYYNGSLAYDAGSLANCNGRYLECGQGRNLFDQVWEQGTLDANGQPSATTTQIRSKNYNFIPNNPNNTVYCHIPNTWLEIHFYDKDFNFIKRSATDSSPFAVQPVPANAMYFKFRTSSAYGGTYHNDISIEIYYTPEQGGEGYGEMHDYIAPIRIDTGNETLKAFDKKLPSGVIERITTALNFSDISFTYDAGVGGWYYSGTLLANTNGNNGKFICDRYSPKPIANYSQRQNGDVFINSGSNTIFVITSDSTNAPTGHIEVRKLEGTTEQGTPFSEYAPINDYSYMAWFDTDGNLVSIPQGCKLFYPVDYKGFTDDLVMYTNGDATALAKNEDITDTALNARGYYKMQVLLSAITDVAGLTYDIESVTKIGNLVNLTIRATNLNEQSVTSGDTLFTLSSDIIPSGTIKMSANVNGTVVNCTISNLGAVSVDSAIAQNETVAIVLTYSV